jgi:hypothetical protein
VVIRRASVRARSGGTRTAGTLCTLAPTPRAPLRTEDLGARRRPGTKAAKGSLVRM